MPAEPTALRPPFIVGLSMIALSLVVAAPAAAEEAPAAGAAVPRHDHAGQLGLSVMPGTGYRMIVRYKEEQVCLDSSGIDSKAICTNDVPVFLDFGVSFGLTPGLDLLTDVRFGLGLDDAPGVGRQFAVAPGLRFWLDRDRPLKFYTTLQMVYDHTRQSQDAVPDSDWGVRNANGIMYDLRRELGLFFQLGETLAFARWFRVEIDVGLGAQVRFP